jgi:hypothetical protein
VKKGMKEGRKVKAGEEKECRKVQEERKVKKEMMDGW